MPITGANGVTYNSYSEYAESGTTIATGHEIVASPTTPTTQYGTPIIPLPTQGITSNTGFVTSLSPEARAAIGSPEAAASAGWSLADIISWFSLGVPAISDLIGNIPSLIGTLMVPAVQAITPLIPVPTPIGDVAIAANNFFNGSSSNQQSPVPNTGFNPGNFNNGNFTPTQTPVNFIACNTYRTLKGIPLTGAGAITRNMAIAAVTDFYAGAIPKLCAAQIVVDYFAVTPNAPGAGSFGARTQTSSSSSTGTIIGMAAALVVLYYIFKGK